MVVEAILGIDLGSTSSRAFIWCPSNNAEFHVENKKRNTLEWNRYEKGDFSSTGYPFEDGEQVYLGETVNADRQSTSLKFGFYVLANASDELVEQYSLVQPLLDRKNDPVFRRRLLEGLRGLLSTLQARVSQICKAKRLAITTIGLSVPAQWNLDFEKIYQELVADIFNHPPSEIYFHTETEALAHHLFKNHLDELQDHGAQDLVLFFDFGGHNMNGCTIKVVAGADDTVNFYRDDSFGAGGGSEQWEYNIGLLCDSYLKRYKNYKISAKNRQSLLDGFNRGKTSLGPENSKTITLAFEEDRHSWKLMLEPQNIDKCFEDALRAPLEVAADRIAHFANLKAPSRRVVVSGGTARNRALQSRLRKMCADASIPEPLFTDTLDINYESLKIAKGVAYAAGNRHTVEEFFQRGAALGLQMRQFATTGNRNPQRTWDDTAHFLLDKKRRKAQRVFVTGRDELKIICDPFWSASDDTCEDDVLHHEKCYDFLYLGKLTRGYWYFKLALTGSSDSMLLTMELSRRAPGASNPKSVDNKVFPLQFDRGTNCVYLGVRGKTLEELGLVAALEPEAESADPPTAAEDARVQRQESHDSDVLSTREKDITLESLACEELRFHGGSTEDGGGFSLRPTSLSLSLLSPPLTEPRAKPCGSLRKLSRVDPYQKRHRSHKKC